MRQSAKGGKFDTEHLWQWQQLPATTLQSVASTMHSFETKRDKERIVETWELFDGSDKLSSIASLFRIGTRGEYSESAVRSFLGEYDREVARMQDLTKRGGTHGSRVWDALSLDRLVQASKFICSLESVKCNFSCKSIGSEDESCMLPSYKQGERVRSFFEY